MILRRRAAFLLCLLSGCADSGSPRVGTLTLTSRNPFYGVAGAPAPDSVVARVVDERGEGIANLVVNFAVLSGGGSFSPSSGISDSRGYVSAIWTLGGSQEPQEGSASIAGAGGGAGNSDAIPLTLSLHAIPVQVSVETGLMLATLSWYLPFARRNLAENLPNNPAIAQHIEARMELLDVTGLGSDIVGEGRYIENVLQTATRSMPVVAMFPIEAMRAEAQQSIAVMGAVVPILEGFLEPFPTERMRLWHGFVIGATGGGGGLSMEDRASWAARGVALPYDAVIAHEMAHSYVANEVLTQFLEVYAHNVRITGSTDIADWTSMRGYTGPQPNNTGLRALLDIYTLVGLAAMSDAYRAILPLHPPYGEVLPTAIQQAFVNAVPPEHRTAVGAKLAMVGINP
ncbi:MAG TPA: hypothetical protein VEB19_15610 [Gemmatimonadaceae bacterium]|nr:hypothetical protein [Gemmatimonadaceae bacterium]